MARKGRRFVYLAEKITWNEEERQHLGRTLIRRTAASMLVLAALELVGHPAAHCPPWGQRTMFCEPAPVYLPYDDLPETPDHPSPWRGPGSTFGTSATVTSTTAAAFRYPG